MNFVKVLLPAVMVIALVGCQKGGFQYDSLKKIQSKEDLKDYELVKTLRCTDRAKVDEDGEKCEGPFLILGEKTDNVITKDPYDRKVTYDDEDLFIKQDDMLGYGTKLLLLENKSGTKCLALFKTKKPYRGGTGN